MTVVQWYLFIGSVLSVLAVITSDKKTKREYGDSIIKYVFVSILGMIVVLFLWLPIFLGVFVWKLFSTKKATTEEPIPDMRLPEKYQNSLSETQKIYLGGYVKFHREQLSNDMYRLSILIVANSILEEKNK